MSRRKRPSSDQDFYTLTVDLVCVLVFDNLYRNCDGKHVNETYTYDISERILENESHDAGYDTTKFGVCNGFNIGS